MELQESASKGFFWSFLSSFLSEGLKFLTKIVLARLLLPSDFGLAAMGLIVIGIFGLFQDFSIGMALVQRKKDVRRAFNTGFTFITGIGICLFVLTYISAPYFSLFFGEPLVGKIIKLLSVTFIITAIGSAPTSFLHKELLFKRKLIPDIGMTFSFSVAALTLAFYGFGVWSLIIGYIISTLIYTVLVWIVCPWRPSFYFNWKIAKELIGFGKYALGVSIFVFILLQGDHLIVGKLLKAELLGFYTMAYLISNLPATHISRVIANIAYPSFSKLQNNYKILSKAFLKTYRLTLTIVMPINGIILILAPFITKIILGDKWLPIVVTLQILCFFGLLRAITQISSFLLHSLGKPQIDFYIMLSGLMILFPTILIFIDLFKIAGVAIAVTITLFYICALDMLVSIYLLKISKRIIFANFAYLLVITLVMIGILQFSSLYILPDFNLLNLMLLSLLGISSYAMLICLTNRILVSEIKSMIYLIFKNEKI